MILHLIKKDFLLIKNYLVLLVGLSILIPIYISRQASVIGAGYISLLISEILITYMLYGSVSTKEQKAKGSILIITTPYGRRAFVQAKYLFILVLYTVCLVLYILTSFFDIAGLAPITVSSIGTTLLVIVIYFGISLPIEFKYGYDATRYISVIAIMSSTFLLPQIAKWLTTNNMKITISLPVPEIVNGIIICVAALLIGYISCLISIGIYSRKSF